MTLSQSINSAPVADYTEPITVVLVDDHDLARQGLKTLLSIDDSIEVVGEAASSREANLVIQQCQPAVVLLDIRLAEGSGLDVAHAVPTIAPNSKIVVLTAYDYAEYVFAMLKLGVAGYLVKTAKAHELRRAIHDAAAGRLVFSPEVARHVTTHLQKAGPPGSHEHPPMRSLTARETDVIQSMTAGKTNNEIARELGVTLKTVEAHVASILAKMNAKNRTQAVLRALRYT